MDNLLLCFSNEHGIHARRFAILSDAKEAMNKQIAKYINHSNIASLKDGDIIKDNNGQHIQYFKNGNRLTIHFLENNLYINWSIIDLSKIGIEMDKTLINDICN